MTIHLGDVPASSTLYIPFATYNLQTGASITLTGLAVTDVEIYKNGSVTQRASDNGYTLLDTDGIDFDGLTGIHGFSIDLSDNSDASFYAVGSTYWVVVSSVTVASQTVNFIAATFRIREAETAAGRIEARVASIANAAITAAAVATDAIDADAIADGAITSGVFAAGAITAAAIATDAIDADALAADAVTEIQSGLATAAALDTVDNFLDTEIAAIKAKTDSLTFTVAGQVDSNIQYVNDVAVTGTGAAGNEWGP